MIRKLNPHLCKPNCEPVYDSLYNIVPFSISTAYPYDSLNVSSKYKKTIYLRCRIKK